MVEPAQFVELEEQDTLDTDALDVIADNNQQCRLTRKHYVELQEWIKGRPQ